MSNTLSLVEQAGKDGKLLATSVENIQAWLSAGFLPQWALDSVAELVAASQWDELNNRFYQQMKFGTGGMRGTSISAHATQAETGTPNAVGTPAYASVGSNVLNDFNIARATIGLYNYCAKFLAENERFETPKLVIAHDVRHFSRHFCELAASVWEKLGGKALIFDGPRATPELSFAVRHLKCTTGIVITASHNPPGDNGYKVYFEDGAQVVSPHAEGIIAEVQQVALASLPPYLEVDLSRVVTLPASVDEAYLDVLEDNVLDPELFEKHAPKAVFTPIHGTGGVIGIPLLEGFGVQVVDVAEQWQQDPRFPTVKSPNPENPEALAMALERGRETGADLVLATDPDGDRMAVAAPDRKGQWQLYTGNMSGSMLAEYRVTKLKEMGIIPQEGSERAALIKTFVTTPLQEAIAKQNGLKCINTLTGFKWIGARLGLYQQQLEEALFEEEGLALDYNETDLSTRVGLLSEYSTFYVFGGEESYGYLASDRVRDKDASAACLMICELAAHLKSIGQTFDEYLDAIYLRYGYYREGLVNIYFEGASGSQKIRNIINSYRENPPKEINGVKVAKVTDFGRETIKDADGETIPKEDFYFLELENGYQYAVRGSGTEPKIKFYVFAREHVASEAQLEATKQKAIASLDALSKALEADARARATGK